MSDTPRRSTSDEELAKALAAAPTEYFVYYSDEGPTGHTGQGMKTTAPRRRLLVFSDESLMRQFIHSTFEGRKNPRIEAIFSTDMEDGYDEMYWVAGVMTAPKVEAA